MIYKKSRNDPTAVHCKWLHSELNNLKTESIEDFKVETNVIPKCKDRQQQEHSGLGETFLRPFLESPNLPKTINKPFC